MGRTRNGKAHHIYKRPPPAKKTVVVHPTTYIPPTLHWKRPGEGIVFNRKPFVLSINEGGRGPIFVARHSEHTLYLYAALWTAPFALRATFQFSTHPGKERRHD